MTRFRRMMLEELQRRNYAPGTIRCHLASVADFACYFHRPPDRLRPEHVREYQAYLFRERKLDASTVTQKLAALRFFFFIQTLRKPWSRGRHALLQTGASPAHRAQPRRGRPAH